MDGSIADSTMLRMRSGLMRSGQTLSNSSSHSFFDELLRLPVSSISSDQSSEQHSDRMSTAAPPTSVEPTSATAEKRSNSTEDDSEDVVSDEIPTDDPAASLAAVTPMIVCCYAPELDGNPATEGPIAEALVNAEVVVDAEGDGAKRGEKGVSELPAMAQAEPEQVQPVDVLPALVQGADETVRVTTHASNESARDQELAGVKAVGRGAQPGQGDEALDDSGVRPIPSPIRRDLQPNTEPQELSTAADSSEVVPIETTPRQVQSTRERRSPRSTMERDKWYASRSNQARAADGGRRDEGVSKTQREQVQDPALMQEMLAHLEPVTAEASSVATATIDVLQASAMTPAALAAPNSFPSITRSEGGINGQINAQITPQIVSGRETESASTASSDALRNIKSSDAGGAVAGSNFGAAGHTGSGGGDTGGGGPGTGAGQGNNGPAGLGAAGRTLADGTGSFDGVAENGNAGETRQLSQQERVRLVQRVARSFSRIGPDGGQVSLRLHPPELGVLNVSIKIEGQAMTARLQTQSGAARDVILESLPVLKERLSEQGIEVEKFQVDVVTADELGSGQSQMSDTTGGGARGGENEPRAEGQDYRRVRRDELSDRNRTAVDQAVRLSMGPAHDRSLDVRA